MAACPTVPQAAPPPWGTRLKNVSSPMPVARAISTSSVESIANVTMPSTSAGSRPASASAAVTASHARRSSVRPESLENSFAPMPTIAARSRSGWAIGSGREGHRDGPCHVLPEPVAPDHLDLHLPVVHGGHAAAHPHPVSGEVRGSEPDPDAPDGRVGARPVGDEAADEAVGGQDVHEDPRHAPLPRQAHVVMHVLVVAAGDGAGDDERRGHLHDQLGQLLSDPHIAGAPAGHGATGRNSGSVRPSASLVTQSSTGMPTRMSAGATPITLETRRVPSSRSTSATTYGSGKAGSRGWWGTAYVCTVPRPADRTASHSRLRHAEHMGRGGCRREPHAAQRWISSSPRSTPSQKKRLSSLIAGRGRPGTAAAASGSTGPRAGSAGRNFSTRNRIVPTSSPSSVRNELTQVTKWPAPSPVRFSSLIDSSIPLTVRWSPGRR